MADEDTKVIQVNFGRPRPARSAASVPDGLPHIAAWEFFPDAIKRWLRHLRTLGSADAVVSFCQQDVEEALSLVAAFVVTNATKFDVTVTDGDATTAVVVAWDVDEGGIAFVCDTLVVQRGPFELKSA
jgi:hypothetical protein